MASTAQDLQRTVFASAIATPSTFTLRAMDHDAVDTAAWDALASFASDPNPFAESWYLRPAIENLGGRRKITLLCLEHGGVLCGLMPIVRSALYYNYPAPHMAGWLHGNAFVGSPLVAPGCERAFWRELFAWADENAGMSMFLHLCHLPLDTDLTRALIAVTTQQGRSCALVHRHERAVLQRGHAPEEHWTSVIGGKKRKELRRQAKRLADEGNVAFTRHTDEDGLDGWIRQFLALEQAGWKGTAGNPMGSDRATRDLFKRSLTGAAQRGRLERLTLTLDDRPIAMLANFITPPGAFAYKTAFDENYARFSPGVLLQRDNLALLEHGDVAWCDSCAAPDHPMIGSLWPDRRAIGRYSVAIGGRMRRALFGRMLASELRTGGPSQ